MFPQSSDSEGSPNPPENPPASFEELYWDIDSEAVTDYGADPAKHPAIEPIPRQSSAETVDSESPPTPGPPRDRSRSLRKSRSEPIPFHNPDTTLDPLDRLAEALPLPAVDLAPRPPRADPIEKAEAPPAATKMPLQRKSGGGVEKFTRFTTRPETSAASGAAAYPHPVERALPLNQTGGGNPSFGKLNSRLPAQPPAGGH